jgi:hypothetical protein
MLCGGIVATAVCAVLLSRALGEVAQYCGEIRLPNLSPNGVRGFPKGFVFEDDPPLSDDIPVRGSVYGNVPRASSTSPSSATRSQTTSEIMASRPQLPSVLPCLPGLHDGMIFSVYSRFI